MEKRDYLIYFLVVLFILIAIGLASCTDKSEDSTGTTTSAETEQESMTTTGAVGSIENEVKKLGAASGRYACYDGSMLTTYKNKTKENFEEIVDYFSKLNYEVYSSHEMNDCLFTTLIKNSQMTHVYWLKDSNELNIIVSSKAGDTLPPANPELTTGAYQTTISQMQGSKGAGYLNGMSYIIQLADGTFIIYDGGYADQAPALFQKLCDLNGGGTDGIHIRAWLSRRPRRGDIIAVTVTGAYNYAMASNYNRIPRPPIVMLDGERDYVAVERESFEDLMRNDK